jgi:hypothetical protein
MEMELFRKLQSELSILRLLLLTDEKGEFLRWFDEFIAHHEFELALHVVCDFVSEPSCAHIDRKTLDIVERLHRLMEIEDDCINQLSSKRLE